VSDPDPGRTGERRRARVLASAAASVAVAVGLTACSSNKGTTPGTTTGTTSSGATSSSAGAGTTTTGASPGLACAASALAMSVAGSEGAAGTLEVTYALRNSSSSSCPMDGFPGAQLLSSSGAELPTRVVRGGSYPFTNLAPSPVVLAPGQTAYFNMGYSDVPTGNETTCPTAAQIEVTPPDAVDHDVVAGQLNVCDNGTLTVSPVFAAGSAGTKTTAPPQP